MRSQHLSGHLTGEWPCPPCSTMLVAPQFLADVDEATQQAMITVFEGVMEVYQTQLHSYKRWQDDEAHASAILVGSMTVAISMDVMELPMSQLPRTRHTPFSNLMPLWMTFTTNVRGVAST